MIIYRGEYVDVETNLANENIQVVKRIDIIDRDSNKYNIRYSSQPGSPGETDYTFEYDEPEPVGTVSILISYSNDGGSTWNALIFSVGTPINFSLPTDDYIFGFTFRRNPPRQNVFYDLETVIIPLELTDDPCRDIVIDNNEDKFTPIRSRQLEINIYSSSEISINTFSEGGDKRFAVKYYVDDVLKFTGFLSMGDLSQEFMPNPNVISMIAVDGLGYLQDIPLTDFDNETPAGVHPILKYIIWALSKTGLRLNLAVILNIREETASNLDDDNDGDGHLYSHCFLDSKTFEDEIGTCENCYDVLKKILGEMAEIYQDNGEWVIMRIDEIDSNLSVNTVFRWTWDGDFISKTEELITANIGIDEDYSWMNDDAIVMNNRPIKSLLLSYKYETPKEVPCNIDFSRGDYIGSIDTNSDKYDLACWEKLKDATPDEPSTADIYIRVDKNTGSNDKRYVVIENNADFNFIMSEAIPMNVRDKFKIDVTRRMQNDVGGSGSYTDNCVQVRLYGDDGTFWTHEGRSGGTTPNETPRWVECNSNFSTNQKYYPFQGDASEDQRDAKSIYDGETAELPVGGYIKILCYQSGVFTGQHTYIDNVSFEYIPYINGSYKKYSEQQNVVTQELDTTNVRDSDVYISDSPNRIFKGALMVFGGVNYELAGLFYDAAREPSGPVTLRRFGEIQVYDVWNQFRRTYKSFYGTIDKTIVFPSLRGRYILTDNNENTLGRIFILLHREIDTHLCEWGCYLTEVFNESYSKQYSGNNFKYITGE